MENRSTINALYCCYSHGLMAMAHDNDYINYIIQYCALYVINIRRLFNLAIFKVWLATRSDRITYKKICTDTYISADTELYQ